MGQSQSAHNKKVIAHYCREAAKHGQAPGIIPVTHSLPTPRRQFQAHQRGTGYVDARADQWFSTELEVDSPAGFEQQDRGGRTLVTLHHHNDGATNSRGRPLSMPTAIAPRQPQMQMQELPMPVSPPASASPVLRAQHERRLRRTASKSASRELLADGLCAVCGKTAYIMEQLQANDSVYHKACFRCCECDTTLTVANFASLDDRVYCKHHYPDPEKVADTLHLPSGLVPVSPAIVARSRAMTRTLSAPMMEFIPAPVATPARNSLVPAVGARLEAQTARQQQMQQEQLQQQDVIDDRDRRATLWIRDGKHRPKPQEQEQQQQRQDAVGGKGGKNRAGAKIRGRRATSVALEQILSPTSRQY